MLPLVAPLVMLALSSAVPTMGKLSRRKGVTKDKKLLAAKQAAAAAAAAGISPSTSPPSSPNKVRGALVLVMLSRRQPVSVHF